MYIYSGKYVYVLFKHTLSTLHFSGSIQNENESLFNYSLTNGTFDEYNTHHTRPRCLTYLLCNLTELFSNYSNENVSLFNVTCWNHWSNMQDNACLLAIAKTNNISCGIQVHYNTIKEHERYERLRKCPTLAAYVS